MAKNFDYFQFILSKIRSNSISAVDLSNQELTLQDVMDFSETLKENTSVNSVELQGNQIGDEAASLIASALEINFSVTGIHLEKNQIGDTGAIKLANSLRRFTSINLGQNQIKDTGALALAAALRKNAKLLAFWLHDNQCGDIGAKGFAEALKENENLRVLELAGNLLTEVSGQAFVSSLQSNPDNAITALVLARNTLTLNTLNQVKSLIVDQVAKRIANDVYTSGLDLAGMGINNSDIIKLAEAIKKTTTLTSLYWYSNQIGDEGVKTLANALKMNTSVQLLSLGINPFSDVGILALADLLKENQSLTALYLDDTFNQPSTLTSLLEALSHNYSLTTVSLFKSKNQINQADRDKGEALLARNIRVTQAVGGLRNNTLRTLDLSNLQITDTGLILISQALEKNTSLTELNVSSNQFGLTGLSVLANALEVNRSLERLYLDNNGIYTAGATLITEALKIKPHLTELFIRSNHLDDSGARVFAEALSETGLKFLSLDWNEIGDEGAKSIGAALSKSINLETLELNHNLIGAAGAQALAEGLKLNRSLLTFSMFANLMGDEGAKAMAAMLKENNSLAVLGIAINQIRDAGALELAEALRVNIGLRALAIDQNQIGNLGFQGLAAALSGNTALSLLLLHHSQVSDIAAQYFLAMLQKNYVLTDIVLEDNHFSSSTLDQINALLARNKAVYPQFQRNTIPVSQGGRVTLTAEHLNVLNAKNITITEVTHGEFRHSKTQQIINSFTPEVLAQGLVEFVHLGTYLSPTYKLTASNDQYTTPVRQGRVLFKNFGEAPHLVKNDFDVEAGKVLTIGLEQVAASFDDQTLPEALEFRVQNLTGGRFQRKGQSSLVTNFTQGEVRTGQIEFLPTGAQIPTFKISVSDGNRTSLATLADIDFNPLETSTSFSRRGFSAAGIAGLALGVAALMFALGFLLGIVRKRKHSTDETQQLTEEPSQTSPALNRPERSLNFTQNNPLYEPSGSARNTSSDRLILTDASGEIADNPMAEETHGMPAEKNGVFVAVADQLNLHGIKTPEGTEYTADMLKTLAKDHINSHQDLKDYFDNEGLYEINREGRPVGHSMLEVLADVMKLGFMVTQQDGLTTETIGPSAMPRLHLSFDGRRYSSIEMVPYDATARSSGSVSQRSVERIYHRATSEPLYAQALSDHGQNHVLQEAAGMTNPAAQTALLLSGSAIVDRSHRLYSRANSRIQLLEESSDSTI